MVMLSKRSSTLPVPTQEITVGLHSGSSLTVRTMLLERTTESGRWNAGHGSTVRRLERRNRYRPIASAAWHDAGRASSIEVGLVEPRVADRTRPWHTRRQ